VTPRAHPDPQAPVHASSPTPESSRRTAVVVPHFTTVPFIVSASDFIATAPERIARMFIKQLKLQSLRAPIEIPPLRLTLLWHERFHADPAHRWMRELIARTAGKIAEDSQ